MAGNKIRKSKASKLPIILLSISCVIVSIFFSDKSVADPVSYINDWEFLDQFDTTKIIATDGSYELEQLNNKLRVSIGGEREFLIDLGNGVFDIYVMGSKTKPMEAINLWAFNRTGMTLANLEVDIKKGTANTQQIPWELGTLEAVFANCESHKGFLMSPIKMKTNFFLSRMPKQNRPKKFNCGYLLNGGRCGLVFDQNDNWRVNDKLIFDDAFNYVGDIESIEGIVTSGCILKSRLKPARDN